MGKKVPILSILLKHPQSRGFPFSAGGPKRDGVVRFSVTGQMALDESHAVGLSFTSDTRKPADAAAVSNEAGNVYLLECRVFHW